MVNSIRICKCEERFGEKKKSRKKEIQKKSHLSAVVYVHVPKYGMQTLERLLKEISLGVNNPLIVLHGEGLRSVLFNILVRLSNAHVISNPWSTRYFLSLYQRASAYCGHREVSCKSGENKENGCPQCTPSSKKNNCRWLGHLRQRNDAMRTGRNPYLTRASLKKKKSQSSETHTHGLLMTRGGRRWRNNQATIQLPTESPTL